MKISFLLPAQTEGEEAVDYYDEQRTGLGIEFSEEVGQALDRISNYPEAWSQLSPADTPLSGQSISLQRDIRSSTRTLDHNCDSTSSSEAGKLAIQS